MKLDFDKVIILGMGTTGKSCLQFFQNFYPLHFSHSPEIICVDANPLDLSCLSFLDHDPELEPYLNPRTLLVWSPGIAWDHPLMIKCLKAKMTIWSEIELASRFFNKPIMALTGTNGKTTTVTLIHHILDKCQVPAFLGGNIGIPFIDAIANQDEYKLAVLELSSFQLEAVDSFHPNFAGILNLFENHEERYQHFDDYVRAKVNITNNLSPKDFFFRRETEPDLDRLMPELKCHVHVIPDQLEDNETFWGELNYKKFPLMGKHNLENLAMAKLFLNHWGLSDSLIEKSMLDFEAVAFRLEKIFTYKNKFIFNDSKSTNWAATNIALKSFQDTKPPILIMGGKLRNDDPLGFNPELYDSIVKHTQSMIAIGEAGPSLHKIFSKDIQVEVFSTLEEALNYLEHNKIIENKSIKEHILFSPGYPSFDSYKNYVQRGEHFTQLIKSFLINVK